MVSLLTQKPILKGIFLTLIPAALLLFSTSPLFSEDQMEKAVKRGLKEMKVEAKAFGKEKNSEAKAILEALFSGEKQLIDSEDLLSIEDRGKEFDADLAAKRTDKQELSSPDMELQAVIDSALKVEEIEGSEDFLITSKAVIENAKKGVGIISEDQTLVPEEQKLETCQEGGSFMKTIDKEKIVTVIPQKTEEIRTCLGHKKEKEFFWKADAESQIEYWKLDFNDDVSLKENETYISSGGIIKNYHAVKKWAHNDGVHCEKNSILSKVIQEEKEVDQWETDASQKEVLKNLELNIDCELVHTQEFNPDSKMISGKMVYRDSWNQRLIFSCKPGPNSKCTRLQEQGGVLIKRKCLKEDDFGDCISWEKTYDLGGKASYLSQAVSFEENEPLFELEDDDASFEKNTEFGQVISTFAALENLSESVSEKGYDSDNPSIFAGSESKCRRSFDSKNLFDCCHKKDCEGQGIFIGLDLGRCSKEERDLFEKNQEGKCHRVGYNKKLLVTEHVYCCFPTKLARIIQEEGRKQLGSSWGKPEKPNCKGLTLQQLQSLDFETMDFSDFIEELQDKVDAQKLSEQLKTMVKGFSYNLSEDQARVQTEGKIEHLKEKTKRIGGLEK